MDFLRNVVTLDSPASRLPMTRAHTLGPSAGRLFRRRLTKADIGPPTGFRHVGHVGWDPETGFDVGHLDPALQKLFLKAGVSERDLRDRLTSRIIYSVIERRGGLEAVRQELRGRGPPAAPAPRLGCARAATPLTLVKGPLPLSRPTPFSLLALTTPVLLLGVADEDLDDFDEDSDGEEWS
nr:PREDICTED: neural Wiskott-Aldrich syndrome protein-like [Lepisosteus oculatus]